MDLTRRVIVALDFDTAEDAEAVVERLGDTGQSYKIGLQLLTAAGPSLVTSLAAAGKDVVTIEEQRAWFDAWWPTVTGWRYLVHAPLSLVRRR